MVNCLTAYDAAKKRPDDVEAGPASDNVTGSSRSSSPAVEEEPTLPAPEWAGKSFNDKKVRLAFIRKVVAEILRIQ